MMQQTRQGREGRPFFFKADWPLLYRYRRRRVITDSSYGDLITNLTTTSLGTTHFLLSFCKYLARGVEFKVIFEIQVCFEIIVGDIVVNPRKNNM